MLYPSIRPTFNAYEEVPEAVSVSDYSSSSDEYDADSSSSSEVWGIGPNQRKKAIASPSKVHRLPFHPNRMPKRSCLKKEGAPKANKKFRTVFICDNDTEIRYITATKALTETPEDLWFSDQEMKDIKRRMKLLVSEVDQNGRGIHDGRKYCTRGVEKYMISSRVRKHMKTFIRQTVTVDNDIVSYAALSERNVEVALQRAATDASVAASFSFPASQKTTTKNYVPDRFYPWKRRQ